MQEEFFLPPKSEVMLHFIPGDTLNKLLLILIQTHSKRRPGISPVHLHLVHLHF